MGLFGKNEQLENTKAQLKQINPDINFIGLNNVLKALPETLQDGEQIKFATTGSMGSDMVLVLVTTTRFLALQKDIWLGLGSKSVDIPLTKVNDVSNKTGMVFGKIVISNGSNSYKITQLTSGDTKKLVQSVQEQADKKTFSNSQTVYSSADEIAKFKKLLDDGVITQEEFDAKKKQLLGL